MRPADSFVAQPIRSLQTMLRVISEDEQKIPSVIPDGIYGQSTLRAVTEFQRTEGLPLTGIADKNTWDRIRIKYDNAITRIGPAEPIEIILEPGQIIKLGDNGPYIYLLQSMLIWLAMDHNSITAPEHTGTFDPKTAQALSDFQILAGLESTGELDRITWKNLSKQFTLNAHHNTHQNIIENSK